MTRPRPLRGARPGVPLAAALSLILVVLSLSTAVVAIAPEVLVAVGAIPAHVGGRFREPRGFTQAAGGHFLVFDRRAHTVFGIDASMTAAYPIVEIGSEPGRILEPSAFSAVDAGSFVVADAPGGQGRVQLFSATGQLLQHFRLPGPVRMRLLIDGVAASGVASLQYTGESILLNQPEWGGLITEYSMVGQPLRTFGQLRPTGHEADAEVHLALNSGLVLAIPGGGFYFVFQAGRPAIRRYDARGALLFERQMQGAEIDALVAQLPDRWPRGADEQPMIRPSVRAAAVDPQGRLWVSLGVPYTYVFDRDGDKVRVLQLRAGGVVSPNHLAFGHDGRLLVTPGLSLFDPAQVSSLPVDTTMMEPVVLQPQARPRGAPPAMPAPTPPPR